MWGRESSAGLALNSRLPSYASSAVFCIGPLSHMKACGSTSCLYTHLAPTAYLELSKHCLLNTHSNPMEEAKRKFREVNQLAKGHPAVVVVVFFFLIHSAALPQMAGESPF